MLLDNLQHVDHQNLYQFYWAAYYKNFTEAAYHCHCSKSHMSKSIVKLERELHLKLFQRTTRQIELTNCGERLFNLLKNIFADLEQGISQLQDLSHQPNGHLRITAPPALAEVLLAPMFGKFIQAYKNITVHCDCESKQIDMIKEGYDFAFRNAKLEDSNYIARHLTDIQFVCVASKKLSKKIHKIHDPQQIKEFPIISYVRPNNAPYIFHHKRSKQFVSITPQFSSNLSVMIFRTLLESEGISILPDFLVAEHLQKKKIIQVLPEWTLKKIPLYLIYPSKDYMPLKNKCFIDFIRQSFS